MTPEEIFARCAAHRRELAELVDGLDEQQLATPSLCGSWDVRTVAAHLTVPLTTSTGAIVRGLLRHRGNFHRTNDAAAREAAQQPVADITATLRARATSRYAPPVGGPAAPLTDLLVHGADIRVPLGLPYDPPLDDAVVGLGFVTGRAIGFVPGGRMKGIRVAPTDVDRTWGSGAELTGRAADLLAAVCGRTVLLDAVGGPGKDVLAARL